MSPKKTIMPKTAARDAAIGAARAEKAAAAKASKAKREPLRLPPGVEMAHLHFLDDLRLTGAVNMFGARPYVADAFGLDKATSARALEYWMETLQQRHPR